MLSFVKFCAKVEPLAKFQRPMLTTQRSDIFIQLKKKKKAIYQNKQTNKQKHHHHGGYQCNYMHASPRQREDEAIRNDRAWQNTYDGPGPRAILPPGTWFPWYPAPSRVSWSDEKTPWSPAVAVGSPAWASHRVVDRCYDHSKWHQWEIDEKNQMCDAIAIVHTEKMQV